MRREAGAAASIAAAVPARAAINAVAYRQMADLAKCRQARKRRRAADLGLDVPVG